MGLFYEYINKKKRESRKQLNILRKVLEQQGLPISDFIEDDEPYIFLKTSNEQVSFDGIRIYKIGDIVAYRIQKEEHTEPYGKPYLLDIEDLFDDLIADDDMNEGKAGKEVINAMVKEFKKFFDQSAEAEQVVRGLEFEKNVSDKDAMFVSGQGTDYSSMIYKTNM